MRRFLAFVFLSLIVFPLHSQQTGEMQMVDLINGERTRAGLPSLILDQTLCQVAAAHAQDMVANGYFSHYSKDGSPPIRRVQAAGYYAGYRGYIFVAENIEMHSGQANVALSHSRLMNSPGHRRNILSRYPNEVGIGFATGQFSYMGRTYAIVVCVQVFAYHAR